MLGCDRCFVAPSLGHGVPTSCYIPAAGRPGEHSSCSPSVAVVLVLAEGPLDHVAALLLGRQSKHQSTSAGSLGGEMESECEGTHRDC